jgi:sterol desaturase/sphingolipid hydroxylase (fatty acid hydroxylase superfamily)
MNIFASLQSIGLVLAAMTLLAFIEAVIPLRARGARTPRQLRTNLVLTFVTFATNMALNIPLLLGLNWLQSKGWGLFNAYALPPAVELIGTVLALDLAWYVTHVTMHKVPALWPFHAVHHADPHVDVTTTIRQHPGEGLIRYAFLAAFSFAVGASPAAYALYRTWGSLHGLTEHANLRLPQWLDTAITAVFTSPNMHKVHHSRDARLTDRNFGNIFSVWDRLGGTFVPARQGVAIAYGLDGEDDPRQTVAVQLAAPFRARRPRPAAVDRPVASA